MNENKSAISQANSYLEIGEFWDNHDVTDYWEQTKPVNFEVEIQSEGRYCAIEPTLVTKIRKIAWQKGISMETLVNLWLQEKLAHEI